MRIAISVMLLVAAVSTSALAQQASCQKPKLEFTEGQRLSITTFVKWEPRNCPMVIETWRNGRDCRKIGVIDSKSSNPKKDSTRPRACADKGLQDVGVTSGTVTIEQIRGKEKGFVSIKLWPHGGDPTEPVNVDVQ